MMRRLRPGILDNLGLIEAFKDEISAWNGRNKVAHAELIYGGSMARLNDNIAIMHYRIVQEALSNISKHASASQVRIEIGMKNHVLSLRINDNGQGMVLAESRPQGLGLIGMRERVETINGTIHITGDA